MNASKYSIYATSSTMYKLVTALLLSYVGY